MSRPIDADALMRAMYERAFETDGDTMWQSGCWVRYRAIEEVVTEQPTIEPRKGKWIVTQKFEDCYYAKCNECKVTQVFYYNKALTNYCPNCGARMER